MSEKLKYQQLLQLVDRLAKITTTTDTVVEGEKEKQVPRVFNAMFAYGAKRNIDKAREHVMSFYRRQNELLGDFRKEQSEFYQELDKETKTAKLDENALAEKKATFQKALFEKHKDAIERADAILKEEVDFEPYMVPLSVFPQLTAGIQGSDVDVLEPIIKE